MLRMPAVTSLNSSPPRLPEKDSSRERLSAPPDRQEDPSQFCPQCGLKLQPDHCKLRCPQCGYYMSCSDYY